MKIIHTLLHNKVKAGSLIIISIIFFLGQLIFINYGNPWPTHPDEEYIIKDCFTLLYKLSHAQFDFTGNLYYYVLSIWYAIVYCFGFIFGNWSSLAEFQSLVISGSFDIYYSGRILSVVLVFISNLIIIKSIQLPKTITFVFVSIILFFNPILWLSTGWIKFEAISYLFIALIFHVWIKDFMQKPVAFRTKVIIFALSLCVRIDFISFFIGYIITMTNIKKFKSTIFPIIKFSTATVAIYLIVTNSLVNFMHQLLGVSFSPYMEKSLEQNILSKLMAQSLQDIQQLIITNGLFYAFVFILTILTPLLLLTVLRHSDSWRVLKEFFKYSGLILLIILVFPFHAIHYAFTSYIFLLLMILNSIVIFQKKQVSLILLSFYYITIFGIVFHDITLQKSPREEATEFILANSNTNTLIAIENYQNPGLHPNITECPEVLLTKSKEVIKFGKGTGESFKLSAAKNDTNCRPIIEISSTNRFSPSVYSDEWINVFDAKSLISKSPKFIVSRFNYEHLNSTFYKDILQEYKLAKSFSSKKCSMITKQLTENEPYNVSFYIYSKKY